MNLKISSNRTATKPDQTTNIEWVWHVGKNIFEWNNQTRTQIGCADSYPFVTGDTFRAFADVVFDNTVEANIDKNKYVSVPLNPLYGAPSSLAAPCCHIIYGYMPGLNLRFVSFALFICLFITMACLIFQIKRYSFLWWETFNKVRVLREREK